MHFSTSLPRLQGQCSCHGCWHVQAQPHPPLCTPWRSGELCKAVHTRRNQTRASQASWRRGPGVCQFREVPAAVASSAPAADASTLDTGRPRTATRGKAVIVGAGPAGALMAVYLAKQDFDVEVHEQRSLPDPMHRNLDRSYHLAMSHRGMGAVEQVGIDMSRFRAFPYLGSLLQRPDGNYTRWFHTPVDSKVLVERMEVVRHIVDEAQRLCPGRIKFMWDHPCMSVDADENRATFEQKDGSTVTASFDLLIGADGVNSRVRQELERQVPGFGVQWHGKMHRIDKFFHHVRPDTPITFPEADLDAQATVLRFFTMPSPPPLSVGLFFIHNHADGTYSGGLSFTRADYTGAGSGGNLRTAEDYAQVLRNIKRLPEDMVGKIAEQLVERPWYNSGSTLQTSRLHHRRVLLVGDAAHAVSAAFGQGVNSALEDCKVFGEVLAAAPDDLDAALVRFDRQRFPDVRALGDMDKQGEAFQGYKGKLNLSYLLFQSHMRVGGFLHRLWPSRFPDPDLVPMMTMQKQPYGAIYKRMKLNFAVAASCCVALVVLAIKAASVAVSAWV